jgi:predicted RNase H-like HicB family nuclease
MCAILTDGKKVRRLSTCSSAAAGDSVEETERLMREATALYLDELRAAGEPIPEPTSIARTVEVLA